MKTHSDYDFELLPKETAVPEVEFTPFNLETPRANNVSAFGEIADGSPEEYLEFQMKGSREGLTSEELKGITKVDEKIALDRINYDEVLELRNGKYGKSIKTSYGKSSGSLSNVNLLTSPEIKRVIEKRGLSIEDFSALLAYDRELSKSEKILVDSIRDEIGLPKDGDIMSKFIPERDIYNYIYGDYDAVGGFVSISEHSKNLNGLKAVYEGNRLDYDGTLFKINDGVSGLGISNSNADKVNIINMDACSVKDSVYAQITYIYDSETQIIIPRKDATLYNAPFTGKGFTASKNIILPENQQAYQKFQIGDIITIYDADSGNIIHQLSFGGFMGFD